MSGEKVVHLPDPVIDSIVELKQRLITITSDFLELESISIDIDDFDPVWVETVLKDAICQHCQFLPHRELLATLKVDNTGPVPVVIVNARPIPSSA